MNATDQVRKQRRRRRQRAAMPMATQRAKPRRRMYAVLGVHRDSLVWDAEPKARVLDMLGRVVRGWYGRCR